MYLEHSASFGGVEIRVAGLPGDAYFANLAGHGLEIASLDWVLEKAVPDDAVILDIGANIGAVSAMLSKRRPNARIISVEPSPKAFGCLNETLAMNAVSNCETHNVAVGLFNGSMAFSERTMLAGSHVAVDGLNDGEVVQVGVKTIDSLVLELGLDRIDLIKLDVEGMELDALKGARATLRRFRPALALEINTYTLITMRNVTPIDLLNEVLDHYPRVVAWDDAGEPESITREGVLPFVGRHLIWRKCFDDIVCLP